MQPMWKMDPSGKPLYFPDFRGMGMYGDYSVSPMGWARPQDNRYSFENRYECIKDSNVMMQPGEQVGFEQQQTGGECSKKTYRIPHSTAPSAKDKFPYLAWNRPPGDRYGFDQQGEGGCRKKYGNTGTSQPTSADNILYPAASTTEEKFSSIPWNRPPDSTGGYDQTKEPVVLMELGEERQRKFNHESVEGSKKKESIPHAVSPTGKEKVESGELTSHKNSPAEHTDTQPNIRAFECQECGKRFARSCQLAIHSVVHSGEKRYECYVCGKKFSQSGNLKRHLVIHTGEKNFSCPECGKMFARNADVSKHVLIHSEEKPFKCDICSKMFRSKSNVIEHVALVHKKVKKFECPDCGKMFPRNSDLKQHSIIHTRVEKVECPECGKQYARNRDLIKHKQKHLGFKKYECLECGVKFARKWDLTKHTLIHSGVKLALVSHLMNLQKQQQQQQQEEEEEEEDDQEKEQEHQEKDQEEQEHGQNSPSCTSDK